MIHNRIVLLLMLLLGFALGKKIIPIGAIFDERNTPAEIAFRYALIRENMYNPRLLFEAHVRYVDRTDSWLAERTACALIGEGMAAVFGPATEDTSNIVASVCAAHGVPHIIAHPVPSTSRPPISQSTGANPTYRHSHTRNFYPSSETLATALADIIDDNGWTTFTLIYEHAADLNLLHGVLQLHSPGDEPITVRQLSRNGDDLPMLKAIRASGATRIVLHCSPERVFHVLRQAQQVQMFEEYQSYLLTAIDAHLVDFSSLSVDRIRSNVTLLRLMDVQSMEMSTAVHDWTRGEWQRLQHAGAQTRSDEAGTAFRYLTDAEHVCTEAAMWHDAVRVFAGALRDYDATQSEVRVPEAGAVRCSSGGGRMRWPQGADILRFMDMRTEQGLTGRIVFSDETPEQGIARVDRAGVRTDFYLEVLELNVNGELHKIALWSPADGMRNTRTDSEVYEQIAESLHNKTIVVTARLGSPYLSERIPKEGETLTGNDRFEGYALDLIDEVAQFLNFQYRFEVVPDGQYGSYNPKTRKWNGLVKELLERKADMAICDLTITFERRTIVDFTIPFMTLGISILYTKPKKEMPGLYQFLKPLSISVWIHMATAFLCIALVQFVLAKFAADDWENPNPNDPEPPELESIWNMANCIWCATGSIMQQGSDLLPKANSTRLLCGLWWFFTLIVIQSYIANLAAVLTKDRIEETIESAEDLAHQTKIKYGALMGGSTLAFFQKSNVSTYQRMWSVMEQDAASVLVTSNGEGVERVARGQGSYAFLMESSSIQHVCNRNCNLTQVGDLLDSKGYGIALPMNSPYRTHVNRALLKLQEKGVLEELKERWWKSPDGDCPPDVVSSDELDMRRLGGLFVLLVGGILAGILIGCGEFFWHTRQVAIRRKITVWKAFVQELGFVLDLRQRRRPNFMIEESPRISGSARSYQLDEWMSD